MLSDDEIKRIWNEHNANPAFAQYNLIIDLVNAFVKLYPESEFRFGHIALSDYNLEDSNLDFCIAEYDKRTDVHESDKPVLLFIQMLREIPSEKRVEPDGWSD